MPYLSKRDTSNLEDRWVFFSSEGLNWDLFFSEPPDDEWVYRDILADNEPDGEALEVYEVADGDARFLIDTFTYGADESDLLDWLRTHYYDEDDEDEDDDDGPMGVGHAIDACMGMIEGFNPRQTNTILCALLAHFGVEK